MNSYYQEQAKLPYYVSYSRQRGSAIGALVAGIGRYAIPFARRVVLPAAKRICRDLMIEAIPELAEVATRRKTPKQAARAALRKTAKRHFGGGVRKGRVSKRKINKKRKSTKKSVKRKAPTKRSRSTFFSKVRDDY